jgi:hypothetical protein
MGDRAMSEEQKPADPRRPETKHTWHDDTPFPKHWIGYVGVKIAILVGAVLLALWWFGLL